MSGEVYITGISKYLPNQPVSNEEMEEYLGLINDKPSRAKRIVLRNNGIKSRYYALTKDGKPTHNNAELAALAIEDLFNSRIRKEDIGLLVCGTATPDQIIPSHASMVHGLLKMPEMEIASFAGSCCASMQAMKYAWFSVKSGNTDNAICSGSEMLSHWMLARYFQHENISERKLMEDPMLAFEKEFLRWMLSDGAAAILIENKPSGDLSLRIDWIEIRSYAGGMETCMYAGAEKDVTGQISGWCRFTPEEWLSKSVFSLKQDTRLLGENIVPLGTDFLIDIMKKRNFDINGIDYFLPHLSSEFFRDKIQKEIKSRGIDIPQEKWFTNLTRVGNIATASFLLMLEELVATGDLKKGQTLLIQVPESARFTYAYAHLTVC